MSSNSHDETANQIPLLVPVPVRLAQEKEEGNEEYKWKLVGLTEQQKMHRVTQLNWRINEGSCVISHACCITYHVSPSLGNGVAVYRIGFLDNGLPRGISSSEMEESIKTLTGPYIIQSYSYYS